ncbi:hypothetical protein Gotur_005849 [Gossypium turneri]
MPGFLSPLIENYLWEASFCHVVTIGWGCKLDLKLISVLIERWRLETHTVTGSVQSGLQLWRM